jgi:hypothetical protein
MATAVALLQVRRKESLIDFNRLEDADRPVLGLKPSGEAAKVGLSCGQHFKKVSYEQL